MMRRQLSLAPVLGILLCLTSIAPDPSRAQAQEPIPHGQSRAPGPPLSPADALARMKVPEGFHVELVASEPEIVNPVAMTFDERGRIWITESLEYPRRSAGPGRDRVKVLEDTDGDGRADRFTVFATGLNIPSGIAVGHGGVWVANSPDILFLQDTDGDGSADRSEVVVSGFGRDDTHELPNSLTWGPDGWLYGWNGVFNQSHVVYRGKTYDFTCAIFRIHPRTREFELFCAGTSNPWGIAFDTEGSAFASACVIDHLWHLTETGYYHRQGGPYPPFTWKIDSIVDHKHQQAAYCGIHFFDSASYPPEFRERLYMGNIHGNCINSDVLERDGSTYRAKPAPDFLQANDAWFMPVVQKTGPDGCLYILDWYDRYHCYQDANRDPEGIDRLKGRLYRVRYNDTPRRWGFDLSKSSDEALVASLSSPNIYDRDIAQRLLVERNTSESRLRLQKLVLDDTAPHKARMHALWTLVSLAPLDFAFHLRLLSHTDSTFRAWGVRAAGNMHKVESDIREQVVSLAHDSSPDVLLQVAIAARKLEGVDPILVLVEVLSNAGGDKLIPHIVWQNLHPLLEDRSDRFLQVVEHVDWKRAPGMVAIMPRVVDRLLGRRNPDPAPIVAVLEMLTEGRNADAGVAREILGLLATKVQSGEIAGTRLKSLRDQLEPLLHTLQSGNPANPISLDAALLTASWKDPAGLDSARRVFNSTRVPEPKRVQAAEALLAVGDSAVLEAVGRALADPRSGSADFRGKLLAALGRRDDPGVAAVVLAAFPKLEPDLQPKAVELLTQRAGWSRSLLQAIGKKTVPATALNLNQVRRLLKSKDAELVKQVRDQWGTVREERSPQREHVIDEMRSLLNKTPGDPFAGQQVFKKVCGQCHKIHGEGQDVGPEITSIGRTDFEQLLSNVFDPSLVIGSAYQATIAATRDGRVLTGLLVEDSPERVVLKTQGGKLETILRGDVEELKLTPLSLMPEDLEKQLTAQEIADLFSFLTLDKPPSDPSAKRLPGAPAIELRSATSRR